MAEYAALFRPTRCPEAKRFCERKKAKTNKIVATKALAHKLARACYHIPGEGKPFDLTRCFAWRTTAIRQATYGDWGRNQLH
jgi:transposase